MYVVYTPADGEEQHYDARTLRVSEVSIVSRTIDQKWSQIQQGLADEELDAMRGVAWVLAKRTNPSLRFGDFDPGVQELSTRMDKDEIESYVAACVPAAWQQEDATEESVRALVEGYVLPTALDEEHARLTIDKAIAEGPKGQATVPSPSSDPMSTSETSETSSSGSSPTSSTSPLPESTT
ncbi:hypothetical protein ACWDXD_20155 [Streptomyces sp. NPDC003314]